MASLTSATKGRRTTRWRTTGARLVLKGSVDPHHRWWQVAEKNAAQVAKMVEGHMNPLNAYLNTMHVKTDVPPTRFSCFSCFGDGFRQWVKFRFQKRGCLRGGLGFKFMTVHPSEVHRFDFFTYVNCCLWYPPIAKIWWVNRRSLLAFYVFMFVSICFTVEDHCSIAETLLSEMCTKYCKAIGPPQKSIMAQYTWKAPKKKPEPKIATTVLRCREFWRELVCFPCFIHQTGLFESKGPTLFPWFPMIFHLENLKSIA